MSLGFPTFYIIIHFFAVLALAITPFIFFNVYADETQNEWIVTIPKGASEQGPTVGFYPDELPVLVGDTIVWKNQDSVVHSITSGLPDYPEKSGKFFHPGKAEPGKSVSFVLGNSDYIAFYYFCEIHPWMTGKIFLSDLPIAQSETDNPIVSDKDAYSYGETIKITGKVHEDFAGTKYTTLTYNQKNGLVDVSHGYFDNDASYVQKIDASGVTWNTNGNYKVKLVYGIPSKVAQTSFQFTKDLLYETKQSIPSWVKNIGDFWCNNQIDDSEFVNAVQFLINDGIIQVEKTETRIASSQQVPIWIKNNACWWVDEKINDIDFISGIEYLVNIGTIRV
jgi:plastocyanin